MINDKVRERNSETDLSLINEEKPEKEPIKWLVSICKTCHEKKHR